MEKNRDQIGEPFMKSGNIDICWIQKKGTQAIEESMRGFVRNDIMAQGRANDAVAESETGAFFPALKNLKERSPVSRL